MEFHKENKIWDMVITLKIVEVKTQPNISIGCNTLCHLHKCSVGLEINKKVRENVESRYNTKLCFIQQRLVSRRTNEPKKRMSTH